LVEKSIKKAGAQVFQQAIHPTDNGFCDFLNTVKINANTLFRVVYPAMAMYFCMLIRV